MEISAGDSNVLHEMMKKKEEREKGKSYREGRKEALEEIKEKFGGGVVVGIDDNDLGVKVDIRSPELDVWLKKELDKLKNNK